MENNSLPIRFEYQGAKIRAKGKDELYSSRNLLIYKSSSLHFYITVIRSSKVFNELVRDSIIKTAALLEQQGRHPIKALDSFHVSKHKIWSVLTKAYSLSFDASQQISTIAHDFDLLKFFKQMGLYVQACKAAGIQLFQLDSNSVVQDRNGNFQLANLWGNLTLFKGKPGYEDFLKDNIRYVRKKNKSNPLAPEVVRNKAFSPASTVWDIGVLAFSAYTGQNIRIDYDRGTVNFKLTDNKYMDISTKKILFLIRKCLSPDPSKRPSPEEMIKSADEGLQALSNVLISCDEVFLASVNTPKNEDLFESLAQLYDVVSADRERSDLKLTEISFDNVKYKDKEMSQKKIMKILMQESEVVFDKGLRKLINLGWSEPKSIVKLYSLIKSKLPEYMASEIKAFKLVVILHYYVYKSSSNTLYVIEADKQNLLNTIIETVLRAHKSKTESFTFAYAHFIYTRVNFLIENSDLISNSFQVSRENLVNNVEVLLTPELFANLFQLLRFYCTFLITQRKFHFNYYFQYFLFNFFKDIKSLVGLLGNMTIYLLFGVLLLENDKKMLNDKTKNVVFKMLNDFLEIFDFVAMTHNIFIEQARKQEFENCSVFKIQVNMPEVFEHIRLEMRRELSHSNRVGPDFFVSKFLDSFLPVMNQGVAKESHAPPAPSDPLPVVFSRILSNFYDKKQMFEKIELVCYKFTPRARFWYEQNVKTVSRSIVLTEMDTLSTSMLRDQALNPGTGASTQTNFKAKGADSEKVKEKARIHEKTLKGENTGHGKDKAQEDIVINGLNVNEFILSEFRRSLDAWIIDFDDLVFDERIAAGSTCEVHRGRYKNMEVAIKKLLTPPNEGRIKFMKEFKRELSLLISLPHHPNLLTLIGFCIEGNNVYLVMDFCEGGTLFDVLYKGKLKFKISFKQKLKIMLDVARGMQFLHQLRRQIIHRDLKSLNILIDKQLVEGSLDFTAKIADFGLARSFEDPADFVTKRMGTFHWMAPEIFSDKPYNSKTDIYAFSIILWEIFAEKTPYYHLDSPTKIIKYVYFDNGRPLIDDCNLNHPAKDQIVDLIKTNWDKNPSTRKEFAEIYNILEGILTEA